MERPRIFDRLQSDNLDAEILERAKGISTDRLLEDLNRLQSLYDLVSGHADHLRSGLIESGFEEGEIDRLAWKVAWKRLYDVLQSESEHITIEVATQLARFINRLNPGFIADDTGEPIDQITRTMYQVFINRMRESGVSRTAAWLYEDA